MTAIRPTAIQGVPSAPAAHAAHPARVARAARVLATLLTLLLLVACAAADLSRVHEAYRQEFGTQLSGLLDGNQSASVRRGKVALFPNTFAEIQKFRGKYPDEPLALKHVAVLEAMIYLQSRQYGLATAAKKAAAKLSGNLEAGSGGLLRDAILLKALTDGKMIDAWRKIDNPRTTGTEFAAAGDLLAGVLKSWKGVPGDEGALYVAGTAAIVYLHALPFKRDLADDDAVAARRVEKEFGQKIMDVMEGQLTEVELAAKLADLTTAAQMWGRYEFVRLYHLGKAFVNGS